MLSAFRGGCVHQLLSRLSSVILVLQVGYYRSMRQYAREVVTQLDDRCMVSRVLDNLVECRDEFLTANTQSHDSD